MGVEVGDLVAVRRAQRSFKARWPRGPQVDVAREAEAAVGQAIRERRPRVAQPQWVPLPQLAGIKPLDQQLVPPLPNDRPLRILELFAGVGTGTQALARLGYQIGEVVACEARGAARVVHGIPSQHWLQSSQKRWPVKRGLNFITGCHKTYALSLHNT
jgi:hypothetical protein